MSLISIPKAAAIIGVSDDTARRWVNDSTTNGDAPNLCGVPVVEVQGWRRVSEDAIRAVAAGKQVA